MEFPIYQIPYFGNGMLIGLNAIIHVLISHGVAIGLFLMIVLSDWMALKSPSQERESWDIYNRRLLKFIVVTTTVLGAMTGVGIWVTTTALAPRAIASMLRIFFWAWFIEWIVFVLEVIVLLIFYFSWDRLGRENRRRRIHFGIGYMALAAASAFLITGILGFMLTPGDWLTERTLFQGFFNPTFWPQLFTRLGLGIVLGALLGLVFVLFFSPRNRVFQRRALRLYGTVLVITLPLLAVAGYIYYQSVPSGFAGRSMFSVLTSRFSQSPEVFYVANISGGIILAAIALTACFARVRFTQILLLPALILFMGFVVEFERIREFIRGPYLMPGYMHVSQVLVEEEPLLSAEGMLPHSFWYDATYENSTPTTEGAFLFSSNCSGCHTIDGINGIKSRIEGRSEDGLYVIIGRTNRMISFMPPFVGSDEERRALARFLFKLGKGEVEMQSLSRHIPVEVSAAND